MILGIIVFVSQFLIAALVAPLGLAAPYLAALVRAVSHGYSLPPLPLRLRMILSNQATPAFVMAFYVFVLVLLSEKGSKHREHLLEERIAVLEKRLPQ